MNDEKNNIPKTTQRPPEKGKGAAAFLRRHWPAACAVAGLVLVLVYLAIHFYRSPVTVSPGIVPGENILALEEDASAYPTDALFITSERMAYRDGDIQLEIPRMNLDCPVLDGTQEATLTAGVGLYEWAQPPGSSNENVSIAGHRDLHGREFYDIDKLTEGDLLYLTYKGKRYTYEYLETHIIDPDDWTPLYCKDFPCLTLTSCHPLSVASQRMVVYAGLVEIQDA